VASVFPGRALPPNLPRTPCAAGDPRERWDKTPVIHFDKGAATTRADDRGSSDGNDGAVLRPNGAGLESPGRSPGAWPSSPATSPERATTRRKLSDALSGLGLSFAVVIPGLRPGLSSPDPLGRRTLRVPPLERGEPFLGRRTLRVPPLERGESFGPGLASAPKRLCCPPGFLPPQISGKPRLPTLSLLVPRTYKSLQGRILGAFVGSAG
jgi:hypothetical protein